MENSSSIARHQMEEVLSSSKSKAAQAAAAGATERKPRPKPEQKVDCPRCKSGNTKFCYYNNYSMSQPRYFCKACRRYWTHGGSLRNVPIGGGCRKTKRSSSSSTTTASDVHSKLLVPPAAEPMMPPTTCMDFPNVLPTFISAGFELPRDQHHLSLAAFVSSSSSLSNPAVAAPVGGTSFLDVLRGGAGLLDSGHRQTQNSGYYGGNGMGMPLPPPSTFGVAGPVQHGGLAIGEIAGATPAQGMLLNGTMMGAGEEGSGGGAKTMMGLQWQPQLGGGGSAAAQQGTSNNVMMDNSNNGGGDGGGPSRDCYWINNGGPNPWQSLINSSSLIDGGAVLEDIVGPKPEEAAQVPLLLRTYPPNSRVYTTLMKGYMNAGRVDDVVAMVRAMRREGETMPASRPDHVTYTTVISTLVAAGDIERAHAVLDEMASAGVPASRVTYNVLIKGYCQQLQITRARELLQEMSTDAGIEPDVAVIDGCVLTDDSAGALALFNEMRPRGVAPWTVSYTTLMKAFAASGQHKVFEEMEKDPRVTVDRAAWNMLVEGYCRQGMLEAAKQEVERMKERGVQPDVATYGRLAKGIAIARKPGEALVLWNEVKERCYGEGKAAPLKPDEELLDALADVCVRGAFFRKALEENGIAPNKTKYKKIYIEMHSRMFTSKHASQARQDRRRERKRAAEAFKFWLGLPLSYYGSEWRIDDDDDPS